MNNILQFIITFLLVALAISYVGYKIYQRFFSKRRHSPCDDCEGCGLKEALREKNCPKSLFPPK